MSRRQRALVLVVVVVIVLGYGGAIANQARTTGGDLESAYDGVVGWLGERFGRTPQVAPADLTIACPEPEPAEPSGPTGSPAPAETPSSEAQESGQWLAIDGSCLLTVAPADTSARELTLHAAQPVTVIAPSPQGGALVEAVAEPGEPLRVTVGEAGAEVELRCRDDDTCQVRVGDSGDDPPAEGGQ